uniref:Uncharacterized protein n=1 Tax=Plectus sambesii TaxID=2011161 RepID=A0A914XT86_9BILA
MTADRRDLISALGGRFVSAPRAMDDDYLVADDSVEGFKNGVPLNVWELEDLLYGFLTPWDELNMLFSKWDDAGFGEIESERFRVAVYDPEFRATMAHLSDPQALTRLEHRVVNDRRPVTYQEFVDLVSVRQARRGVGGDARAHRLW